MAFNISYKFTVTDGFSRPIRKFRESLKKIGPAMTKVARKVQAGAKAMADGFTRTRQRMQSLSVGIVAFGLLAGRSILTFQKGMNKLEASTIGVTKQEMVKLSKVARELGGTTAFTAGQAAFAMAELGVAGFTARQNIETIPSILSLASAGSLELAQAAGIVSGTLKGFGIDTKETIRVADVLALAASSAKTTVSEMGQALSQVGPIAKTIGIDFETTSAALAVFQDQNIGAARAGTGLRGIMVKLSKFTPEAAKAFKKMGISTREVAAAMKKGDIIGLFKRFRAAGLDAKRAAQIFGLETVTTALAFANSTDKIEKMTASLRKAEGTSKRMAKTQLQGLPGALAIAVSSFESMQLSIGEAGLTKRLTQMADGVRDLSRRLEEMSPENKAMIVDFGIGFVAITALLVPLAAVVVTVGAVASAFAAIVAAPIIGGITVAVLALVAALGALLLRWDNVSDAFNKRGAFGALGALTGFNIEADLGDQRALTKRLEQKLQDKGISVPSQGGSAQVNGNVNVNVKVRAEQGTGVTSVESDLEGINGDVGLNLAGAR